MLRIRGRVISGVGRAGYFTGLDWVKRECEDKVGFVPYPGTLNVKVDAASAGELEEIKKARWSSIQPPPGSAFRPARVLRAAIGGIPAAIVVPSEDVNVHPADVVEVIAPVGLREALRLKDGDNVEVLVVQVPQGRVTGSGAQARARPPIPDRR